MQRAIPVTCADTLNQAASFPTTTPSAPTGGLGG